MAYQRRSLGVGWGNSLPLLAGIAVLASVVYFPLDGGTVFHDVPEILLPLVISIALVGFVGWSLFHSTQLDVDRIAKFGWIGALGASVTGGWWVLLHLLQELPLATLNNEIVTIWSLGIGVGVLVGASVGQHRRTIQRSGRARVLAETTWTNRSTEEPILEAIVDVRAELDGADPLDLDPLYEHVNPDVFRELRSQPGSQWQLVFYADEYEFRVSSHGTVSVYDATPGTATTRRTNR